MNANEIIGKLETLAKCCGKGSEAVIMDAVRLIEQQKEENEELAIAHNNARKEIVRLKENA